MKKLFALLLAALMVISMFAGCSKEEKKSTLVYGSGDYDSINPIMNEHCEIKHLLFDSLVKLDTHHHAGAVQNMKFSKDLFNNHRDILKSLLDTYFDNGGAQAMITVVSKDDLEQAMIHPEKYGHIMVRVGGFSARFVTLAPDVQREIASRTLY